MRKLFYLVLAAILPATTFAQTVKLPMPRTINNSLENERGAAISGDGRTMVFMRENARKKVWDFYIAKKKGRTWGAPEELLFLNKSQKLNYVGGYCLSYDGKTLFYSSVKYGGVGNWDIWKTELRSTGNWSTPENLAKPVNSTASELCPSVSANGDYLYFIRQDRRVGPTDVAAGKIMVSERRGSSWSEPTELPSNISTGQETSPRILADGESLLFSSKRAGGKGGHDVYISKNLHGNWSEPKPYEFINTDGDDMFASIDAKANAVYFVIKEDKEDATEDIFRVKIPDEDLKPNAVVLLTGIVRDADSKSPLKSIIQAVDMDTKKIVYTARPDEAGKFYMVLGGERQYDFSAQILDKKHAFYSELFDLSDHKKYKQEKRAINVVSVKSGKKFVLNMSGFDKGALEPTIATDRDIKKLLKLLRNNPSVNIEVGVHTDEVLTDTIRSNVDLSEVIIDTSYVDAETGVERTMASETDDAEQVMVLKYTYHNDRTKKQAKAFKELLELKGVPVRRVKIKGYGAKENITSNDTPEGRAKNRRIEIKFL